MPRRLLLLSNSRDPRGRFLEYPRADIQSLLGSESRTLCFIPFASVRSSWEDYQSLAAQAFRAMGYELRSVHREADARKAIAHAGAIVVGGGNTFHLLAQLQERDLLEPIRAAVEQGTPYVGWSAGSVVACPTIMTTNDMPIVAPHNLDALGLVPFQINAHYTDAHPEGFQGETRAERLAEFIAVNPRRVVIGLPEGTMLRVDGARMTLVCSYPARLFVNGAETRELAPGAELDQLLTG